MKVEVPRYVGGVLVGEGKKLIDELIVMGGGGMSVEVDEKVGGEEGGVGFWCENRRTDIASCSTWDGNIVVWVLGAKGVD